MLMLGACAGGGGRQQAGSEPGVRFADVEMTYTDHPGLPSGAAQWMPFTLPYQASLDTPILHHYVWFRLRLPGPVVEGDNSLYLNNHMFTADIYLNDYRIGGSNVPAGKLAMGWNRPLLVELPAGLWQNGENTLLVRLEQARYTNFMAVFLIGEHTALYRIWQSKVFWQNQVPLVAFLLCMLMGSFTLALWWQRRQDQQYGLFAGTALCWAVPMLYLAAPYDLIPHTVFLIVVYWATILSACFFLPFNLRVLGLRLPQVERILIAYAVLICLTLPLVSAVNLLRIVLAGQAVMLGALAILLGYASWRAVRHGDVAARWMTISGGIILMLLVRDVYEFGSSARSNTLISSGTYMQYSFPIALTGFFVQLLKRFVAALDRSELLNLTLKERVEAVSTRLELSFEANRELELRKAAELQRSKIFRDLHDDVGARLVSIMHASASEEQSRMARSALVSLRETVAGTPARAMSLPELLGQISEDLAIRCRNSDQEFALVIPACGTDIQLGANVCYQISRIIQEVLTNSIKHAGATLISFAAQLLQGTLHLELRDNGRGMSEVQAGGSGVRNIRYRAAEINARISWEPAQPRGCRFVLELDLKVQQDPEGTNTAP